MRRVFITGASTGIGAALVRHYASANTSIGLFARRRDLLEKLASSLPGRTAIYPSDISDTAAVTPATARLRFAHSDWSGYSVFEEAFRAGMLATLHG